MNSALQLKWVRVPSACFVVQNRETHTEYIVHVCVMGFSDTVEWTVSRRFSQFFALVSAVPRYRAGCSVRCVLEERGVPRRIFRCARVTLE